KLGGSNSSLQTQLGMAYFQAGNVEEGIAAFEKAAQLDPSPRTLNVLAYDLAGRNVKLPEAERFAIQAVEAEEAIAAKISLAGLAESDLRCMEDLAAYWDTLGWVYFQQRDYEEA